MLGSATDISSPTSKTNNEDEDYFFTKTPSFDMRAKRTTNDSSNPFFQYDMKFDSLKNYVDSVTAAVNQHAALINKIKTEVGSRVYEQNLSMSIDRFANCINIKDVDQNIMITALRDQASPKEGENALQGSVNRFCAKLEIVGNSFSRLSKTNQSLNERVVYLESDLNKKVSIVDLKDRINNVKTEMKGEMNNNIKNMDEKLKEVEKKYLEKVGELENKLNQLEKEKEREKEKEKEKIGIRSSEGSPTSGIKKINLNSTMKDVEDKLLKEVNKVTAASKASLNESGLKMKSIEENMNRQLLELSRSVDEIKNRSPKKQGPSEFELIYKELKKYTANETSTLKAHVEKSLSEFGEKFAALNTHVSSLAKLNENEKENKRPQIDGQTVSIPLGKISEIENCTLATNAEISKLNEQIRSIQQSLKEKVEYNDLKEQLKVKVDKDEFLSIISKLEERVEKHHRLEKAIDDLNQKTDKVNHNFDRKVAKLKKEFDLESLIKQFKHKADEGIVKETFSVIDTKINDLHDGFASLRNDLEKTMDAVTKGPTSTSLRNSDNPFITIKSVLPKACLSCGNSNAQQPHTHFAKRLDNKAPLKERADRPDTAANIKSKVFGGTMTTLSSNHMTLQGFGSNYYRVDTRHDSKI